MKYLLVKEKGNDFKLYSPDTYGMETWGGLSQSSIIKKKKHWYVNHWAAGNDWIEDDEYEYKLNVVKETTDVDEIIQYLAKYNEKELESIIREAQQIYKDYLNMQLWFLSNY